MNSAFFRRRAPSTRQTLRLARVPRRRQPLRCFFRPLVESLESRELLAFDLTISTDPTANVSSDTSSGTRTFTATGSEANLSLADMDSAFSAGLNVVVSSGSGVNITDLQPGSISTSGITTHVFNNDINTTLTISSGTGTLSQLSTITLAGLQLAHAGSLIIDANLNVSLSNTLIALTISVTAESGSISMPSGGLLQAKDLTLTAGADIGTSGNIPILTSVSQLTTDTIANDGDQFITEANGLTALNVNAGTGMISLNVSLGSVSDTDTAVDISANRISIQLLDGTAKDFGSAANPIGTSVDDLGVATSAGNGNQFITQSKGLTQLGLLAGGGDVALIVSAGSVDDIDTFADISASTATVTLSAAAAKNFGSAANPINTKVSDLSVNTSTSAGGNQFITEANGLTALNLNAGTGDVTLTVTEGSVSDTDPDADITAANASVLLNDSTAKDFGTAAFPIGTNVSSLSVSTSAGNGNQFITESNGLDDLQLLAGTGNVTLTVAAGAVADTDAASDIVAAAANITLGDATAQDFGEVGHFINTSVDNLTVNTSAGKGAQNILEVNGLTSLNLNAGSGFIALQLNEGAILDNDTSLDIVCGSVGVETFDSTAMNIGAAGNPLGISAGSVNSETKTGGGSQFITVPNNVSLLLLDAGTGDATLTTGGITDSDASNDIVANNARFTITSGSFGTAAHPVSTQVSNLSVDTTAGNSNQFITEADSTTVTSLDAGTGTITLTGGTFNLATGDALGDNSALVVNTPAVVNLGANDETIGSLAGSGTVAFKAEGHTQFLTLGGNDQNTTFSGSLIGNDAPGGSPQDELRKIGTGTLTLSGSNSFTGAYSINGGTLLVTGSLATSISAVSVDGAGVLGGTGTLNRPVFASGHLAPGTSPGVLNTDNLQFFAGSAFDGEITSGSLGGFDQAKVTGSVIIDTTGVGVALNVSKFGSLNLQDGQQLTIINNDGTSDAVQGTFKNLPEGANLGSNFLGSGLTATISYKGFTGNDNDVVLTMSPGSLFPWHNSGTLINDVAGSGNPQPDGSVAANDVLTIINYINAHGSGPIPENAVIGLPFGFLDAKADNQIVADDVLQVINYINAGRPLGGESPPESLAGAQETGSAAPTLDELIALFATDASSRRRAQTWLR
jgi:autotransporter-associated beta strand protein